MEQDYANANVYNNTSQQSMSTDYTYTLPESRLARRARERDEESRRGFPLRATLISLQVIVVCLVLGVFLYMYFSKTTFESLFTVFT
jgi:hypothetical protein